LETLARGISKALKYKERGFSGAIRISTQRYVFPAVNIQEV
jgi:hypothetical protein